MTRRNNEMARTLTTKKIVEVRTLIRQGLSAPAISMVTGVCLKTVEYYKYKKDRMYSDGKLRPYHVEPYKCECGYVVALKPCVICAANKTAVKA
jgi:hypothetical protein